MSRFLVPAILGLALAGFSHESKAQVFGGFGNAFGPGYGYGGPGGVYSGGLGGVGGVYGLGYPGVSYYNSGYYGYRPVMGPRVFAPGVYRPYGYGYGGYGYRGRGLLRRGYRY